MKTEKNHRSKSKKIALLTVAAVLALVTAATLVLSACGTAGDPPMVDETYLSGHNTAPDFEAYYSVQVADVLASDTLDDATKAAYLWVLAGYNHGQSERFAYFQNKLGETDLGSEGKGKLAYQQYHKELRANDAENFGGGKYHYTIKHVYDSTLPSIYGDMLEDAAIRFVANVDGLNGLYRFKLNGDGEEVTQFTGKELLGEEILTTKWQTGSDWGKAEKVYGAYRIVENDKSLDEVMTALENDIQTCEMENRQVMGNINTLGDGVVKDATITPSSDGSYYTIVMTLDLGALNADARSIQFLEDDNTAKNMKWNKCNVTFEMWKTGLFKSYSIEENWSGKIVVYDGSAEVSNKVFYSYTAQDCSMDKEVAFLKEFDASL